MRIKQLAALSICQLAIAIVGSTTLALLPVYLQQLGADEYVTGLYFSLIFVALTLGAMVSGPLSNRFQARKWTIVLAAGSAIPATFLMGQVSSIVLLTALTMIVYFVGSLTGTTVNILTGMYANPASRGLVFGVIAAAPGLAAIVTGFTTGPVVDQWGFGLLFALLALAWAIQLVAALTLEDRVIDSAPADQTGPPVQRLNRAFWLVVAAVFMIAIAHFSGSLGRPMAMRALGFDATAITSTVAASGFVVLLLPFMAGWLSDRLGRRPLLLLFCAVVSLGAGVLSLAVDVWQFQLAAALFVLSETAGSVSRAYVTDLVPADALSTAHARLAAAGPLAGILGYSMTGFALQGIGTQATFMVVAALPVFAAVLLLAIRQRPIKPAVELEPVKAHS